MTAVEDGLDASAFEKDFQAPPDDLSILGNLRVRRQAIVDEQILPLAVPRWDNPKIVVKYKPVPHQLIRSATSKVDNAPAKDKARVEIEANCDVLIHGCVSVVAVLDGKEYSMRPGDPTGEPTMFDEDLGKNLGLDVELNRRPTAREIVRKLFITEPDILAAASKVSDFSGYRTQEADEGLSGES